MPTVGGGTAEVGHQQGKRVCLMRAKRTLGLPNLSPLAHGKTGNQTCNLTLNKVDVGRLQASPRPEG